MMEILDPTGTLTPADPGDEKIVLVGGVLCQEGIELILFKAAPIVLAGNRHVFLLPEYVSRQKIDLNFDLHI
jgi:hypothetical protein